MEKPTENQIKQNAVTDPDNVPEVICDGRINITPHGNVATLTFTHFRPSPVDIFDGRIVLNEVVRARITMSAPTILALKQLLNQVIVDDDVSIPPAGGSSTTKH